MFSPDFPLIYGTHPDLFHNVNAVGIDPVQNVAATENFWVRPANDVVYIISSAAGCTFRVFSDVDDQGIPLTNTVDYSQADIGAGEVWMVGPFPPQGYARERGLIEMIVFGGTASMFGLRLTFAGSGGGAGDDANVPANSQLLNVVRAGDVIVNNSPLVRIDNSFAAFQSGGAHINLDRKAALLILNGDSSEGSLTIGSNADVGASGRRLFFQTRGIPVGQHTIVGPLAQRNFANADGWVPIIAGAGVTDITAYSGLAVTL